MRRKAPAAVVMLVFVGSCFAGEQPVEKAALSSDATCSTFDSQRANRPASGFLTIAGPGCALSQTPLHSRTALL